MKCQEENFYYITVPRVQKTFTQKYLCKLSPHRQLNKTVYWQLGLFMVNNLSHKSFSMNPWDYKQKLRSFNQWRNEGSKAKGWVPVCSLSYFVKEFVYFYAHIAREQCLIIQNHASRSRKKNILVLRSLWILPASKSITHHMSGTDGADVFTPGGRLQFRPEVRYYQFSIASSLKVHLSISDNEDVGAGCRFLIQMAARPALRSPVNNRHLISDQPVLLLILRNTDWLL